MPLKKRITIELDLDTYHDFQQVANLKGTTIRSILTDFVSELVVVPIHATSDQASLWKWLKSISGEIVIPMNLRKSVSLYFSRIYARFN